MNKTYVKYFGFGTNKDLDMMVHMVGRSDLVGEPGRLIGFDVCIQKSREMREEIPETSPLKIPPKDLIIQNWGPDFDMFVSRPNPNGIAYGTIWDLTQDEIDLVKEWEAVDYGVQDEVWAIAIDSKGHFVQVETQTLLKPTDKIDRIITGEDYDPYIAPKKSMLDLADDIRIRYLERKKKGIR
ncbi:hypothetical protein A2957_02860 [Candidatus Roizmanbacteria bacterium RIFCSPLOWO2_01_FULL_38_11]|uniref:Gamma-glutamylcyclotransferase AIG2-like domain-containing protein n=1 Tax=Candidatus Roizmanbacteria bacterium RIFCSPLOWO2_01_FULL_38_11 TaxID=1802060 RepID=A0A1F7IJY2_9BACT|nr:MAG: hypothetical protein A2957_02860 [Candidatus Roizmanbacteria bacterium RIFCSPLOWO2_01_FULL_38_11]